MLTDYYKTIFSRSTVGRGVRKAGLKGGGGLKLPLSSVCKIAACAQLGVTLKRLRGVDNASVAVEESRVLNDKSGTVLKISFDRFLVFNRSLKASYPFCS